MKRKKMVALLMVIAILFGAWLFAALFFRYVKVPTGAMKNTILPGDRLVVNRFALQKFADQNAQALNPIGSKPLRHLTGKIGQNHICASPFDAR